MIRTANIYKVNLEEVSLLQRAELPKIDPESSAHLVCAKSYDQNKKWRESTMKFKVGQGCRRIYHGIAYFVCDGRLCILQGC